MASRRTPGRLRGLGLLIPLAVLLPLRADDTPIDEPPVPEAEVPLSLTRSWTPLLTPQRPLAAIAPLPEDSTLQPLEGLRMEGLYLDHPFHLGEYTSAGQWGLSRGVLQPIRGTNTALRLACVDEFELEGEMHARGLGGWFLLLGWNEGHGYGLYNVEMKESGSPWFTCEFRDAKALESTHGQLAGLAWKQPAKLTLRMQDKKLLLRIGKTTIIENLDCPNYHAGDLILGTYNTKYGPKRLQIRSLRIRAPE